MINKYRRDQTPYPDTKEGLFEWGKDLDDPKKRIVEHTRVGRFWVSTVWVGLNRNYGGGKPLIFESMVFDKRRAKLWTFNGKKIKDMGETKTQVRYSSLDDAIAGHAELCREFKKKKKSGKC